MSLIPAFAVWIGLFVSDGTGPRIASPNPVIDLGDVFQGDVKTAIFVLENQGDAPLGLMRIVPKCGCTIAKLRLPATGEEKSIPMISGNEPFLLLAPAEKCEVVTTFNSSGQALHRLHKDIEVESNDTTQPRFRLTLEVNLLRVAIFEPQILNLGNVTRGDTREGTIKLRPGDGITFDIARVAPVEHVEYVVETTGSADAKKQFTIQVKLLGSAPIGHFSRTLQIETTLENNRLVKIPVFAHVRPAVVADTGNPTNSSLLDFGVIEPGKPAEKTLELTNARPDVPYLPKAVTVDSPVGAHVKASLEEIEKGVRYRVRVTTDSELRQRYFKGTLKVTADHADVPELQVQFIGLMKL